MKEALLVPAIEHRLSAVIEMNRQRLSHEDPFRKPSPVVTISREFGCEAFPTAERLKALLEERTQSPWVLMEKALLERLAATQDVDAGIFDRLGDRSAFLDDMMSVLSVHWKSHKDYYQVLCRLIAALAARGNVIFVGRGGSVLLEKRENAFHFRMVAPLSFRIRSLATRLGITAAEAEEMILAKQGQRESFIKDFLGRDVRDPCLYHLVFNNARNAVDRMAEAISGYVPGG